MSENKLAVLILAAGSSKRLGSAKQLVKYKDETLLEISVKKALSISDNVFVVLGNKKEECEEILSKYKINILYNKEYEKGIGNSLSFGISNTISFDNMLIMLCDQPFIPNNHFEKLIDNLNKEQIVATKYSNSKNITVPAIFPKKYYKELIKLNSDFGAKSLLQNNTCINVELNSSLSVDIDTLEDIYTYLS